MKRIEFVKILVVAGLGTPILAACGESNPPVATQATPTTGAVPTVSAGTTPTSQATAPASSAGSPVSPTQAISPVASPAPVKAGATAAASTSEPLVLHFSEFYTDPSNPVGLEPSDKIKSANGKQVQITGYMAPPLKPALDFFVLTRIKLVVCPFCSTATDWPQDIVLVTMPNGKTIEQMEDPLTIIGKLEVGEAVDPQTGFFSLLRLRAESIDVFKGS